MFAGVSFQQGGIIGGAAQVFSLAFPQLSVQVWVVLIAVLAIAMLIRGQYSHIEKTCAWLVTSLTLITVACAVALFWTPYAATRGDLLEGFKLDLPAGGLAVAFATFGITGVGATELVYYPYWCLEKGYARLTGRSDGSAAWLARARGWIRVMQIDTVTAMVIYTVTTVAFYLLGAGVLHGEQKIPAGYDMIRILSSMYTTTLGDWAFYLFLLGAFFVLYSTTFSATASTSHVLVDFLDLARLLPLKDQKQRLLCWRWVVVGLIALCTFWYLILGIPVVMVIVGGIAQACMLPILGFSAIHLRYRHTEPVLRPGLRLDVLLWLASTLMLAFAAYTLLARLWG
jgi:Mn2+/Fe2+ NRAMP family transporter